MSFHTPTAWLAIMVHKTVRQLNDDGGVDIGVICQWDGQDVALLIDSSSETAVDRKILACLEVDDRFSVKGRMSVTPILDNGNVALRVSLLVQNVKDDPKKSDKSCTVESSCENIGSNSGGSSSESSSDGSSSESSGEGSSESGSNGAPSESSSDGTPSESGSNSAPSEFGSDGTSSESGSNGAPSEFRTDSASSSKSSESINSPSRYGQNDRRENIDQRRPSKRQRRSASVDDPQDAGEGQGSSDNNSLVLRPPSGDPQVPVPPSPSSFPNSNRTTFVRDFNYFDGYGYRREYGGGPPLRNPPHAEESFVFVQQFSDGRTRSIRILTNSQEIEGANTLILHEHWIGVSENTELELHNNEDG